MIRLFLGVLLCGGLGWSQTPFHLSLTSPPRDLDPHHLRASSGQYLSQQLFRHFYRLSEDNEFVPELGERCIKKPKKWTCHLKKNLKWSNGQPITAEDFVLSYRRILTRPSPRADLLAPIANAQDILNKKKPASALGVKAVNPHTLEIQWEVAGSDYEYILMSPVLVPLPEGDFKPHENRGPYKLTQITSRQVVLEPNEHYHKKNDRPPLHWLLYEDTLAIQAYRQNQLDFLRRITTSMIPTFQRQPGFRWTPVNRLDSLVMGPSLLKDQELRRKLIASLDYQEMQSLYHSPHRPGCFGMPLDLYEGDEICYHEPAPAKENLDRSLSFIYSALGGEDHRRLSEWLQSQWRTKLGIKLQVKGLENKIFLQQIASSPPDIYRKGLSPENPTCHGSLEIFTSKHPDNFLKFQNPRFDELVGKLSQGDSKSQKKICREALLILKESELLIPTGRLSFAMAVHPQWNHVRINSLNHLDLSELSMSAPVSGKTSK